MVSSNSPCYFLPSPTTEGGGGWLKLLQLSAFGESWGWLRWEYLETLRCHSRLKTLSFYLCSVTNEDVF